METLMTFQMKTYRKLFNIVQNRLEIGLISINKLFA